MATKRNRKKKIELYKDSGSPFNSWEEFVAWNETQPCMNPACTKKRFHRAKYCPNCSRFASLLGDPRLRALKHTQWKPYADKAKEVIDYNLSNIIVTDFCDKLTTIVDHAKQGLPVEWASWFKHLDHVFNHNSLKKRRTPLKLLAEYAGVYMFYHETGSEFIKTERMWHYTLADITLRGVKQGLRRPWARGRAMGKFGRHVWQLFSRHFLPIARGTIRNEKLKEIREQKLAEAEAKVPLEVGID